jgi:hypothetical protein
VVDSWGMRALKNETEGKTRCQPLPSTLMANVALFASQLPQVNAPTQLLVVQTQSLPAPS